MPPMQAQLETCLKEAGTALSETRVLKANLEGSTNHTCATTIHKHAASLGAVTEGVMPNPFREQVKSTRSSKA